MHRVYPLGKFQTQQPIKANCEKIYSIMQAFTTSPGHNNMVNVYKQHPRDNLLIIVIVLWVLNIVPDSQIDYKILLSQVSRQSRICIPRLQSVNERGPLIDYCQISLQAINHHRLQNCSNLS